MSEIKKKSFISKIDISMLILLCVAVAVVLGLSFTLGSKFLSVGSFASMATQIPEFGILVLAMSVVLLTGGLDLSVVANANLATIIGSIIMLKLMDRGTDEGVATVICLLIVCVCASLGGLFNGILIAKAAVYPMLATMATMIFYNGISMVISSGNSISGFPETFSKLGRMKILGIPTMFFVFLLLALILGIALRCTVFGKVVYLFGTNKVATLFSGINTEGTIIKTYMLAGLLCGISGFVMMTRVNSAKVGYGDSYLLQSLLVAILGGISATGGNGSILGVVIATCVMQMMSTGLTLYGLEAYYRNYAWGILLIAVLILNSCIKKRRAV